MHCCPFYIFINFNTNRKRISHPLIALICTFKYVRDIIPYIINKHRYCNYTFGYVIRYPFRNPIFFYFFFLYIFHFIQSQTAWITRPLICGQIPYINAAISSIKHYYIFIIQIMSKSKPSPLISRF